MSLEVIGGHWRSLEVIGGHRSSLEVIGECFKCLLGERILFGLIDSFLRRTRIFSCPGQLKNYHCLLVGLSV